MMVVTVFDQLACLPRILRFVVVGHITHDRVERPHLH